MFNMGFSEMLLLAAIALIFIGPKQLPEMARVLGKFINDLKRTTNEVQSAFKNPDWYNPNTPPPPENDQQQQMSFAEDEHHHHDHYDHHHHEHEPTEEQLELNLDANETPVAQNPEDKKKES